MGLSFGIKILGLTNYHVVWTEDLSKGGVGVFAVLNRPCMYPISENLTGHDEYKFANADPENLIDISSPS